MGRHTCMLQVIKGLIIVLCFTTKLVKKFKMTNKNKE